MSLNHNIEISGDDDDDDDDDLLGYFEISPFSFSDAGKQHKFTISQTLSLGSPSPLVAFFIFVLLTDLYKSDGNVVTVVSTLL